MGVLPNDSSQFRDSCMFTSSSGDMADRFAHVSRCATATLKAINHMRFESMRDLILEGEKI